MALFKISKGLSTNLMTNVPNAKEGFAYFTTDDGKFYIDIDGDGSNNTPAVIGNNRIPLNAYTSDILKATSMGTNDNVVYPLLTFKIKDSTKNLIEAKYGAIGIKNGTLVIPNVNNNDEILISNTGAGRGIVIDNTNGTGHAIEITAGKGIKVAKDPVDNLELATKQYVDNQNVVLELNMADTTYWIDQTSYDFTLSAKAQVAYSRLEEAINKGYTPTVIIHDIDSIYTYKYSFTQNLIFTALLVFTVEVPLSNDANHMGKDFIAFQSNVSGTTLTVQRINKPLEYIPGDGKVNQILSVSNNGQATWLDIPSIGDLGGATKDHTHDDRYYTETEIDDKLKALLGTNDAMIFKGIVNKNTDLPDTHETGWTYRVNKAGTYAGKVCEIGDLVICVADGLSANDSHWTVAQTNIDGAVIGPNTSTANAVSTFADATGKVIKDNPAVTIDNTGLFAAPYIATGTEETHYFQSKKFRGEGDANTYYHAVDFGYAGHNQVDFHEYGGIWNFYENTKGTKADGKLVASIKPDGFHGNLKGNADTATKVNNNLVIKLNSGTTEGTNQFTYNGSATKNIDITPANIGAASSSHTHDSSYVKKSGDTMTGDLKFQKTNSDGTTSTTATIGATTGYITGTWLQTTAVGNKTGDFATIDGSGWIYKRTPTQVLSDIGAAPSSHNHNSTYLSLSGGTLTGNLTAPTFYGKLNGNADTATKFKNAQSITLTGDVTGTASSQAGWSITTTLSNSGVTSGTYGPTKNVNGSNGATISVPQITVDAKGRVTSIVNRTYTSVNTDTNTDTKVTTAAQTSSKIYVTGTPSTGTVTGTLQYNANVYISGNVMYGACWNDYAEYRISDCQEPGRVICENGDDTLSLATERLQPAGNVISDTFGFTIGETEMAKTPVAVSGRVLAYPYESREEFKKNIGRPVCSGPNGTVSIMTDEEYRDKGYCAIGTISAVPDYEEWGTGKVKVNGRVWIKVF